MSERATLTIKTSAGDVVHYESATGGDVMDLEIAAAESGTISRSGDVNVSMGKAYQSRLRKLTDLMIVSIGEKKDREGIWSTLRALPAAEYTTVMTAITRAADGLPAAEGKA